MKEENETEEDEKPDNELTDPEVLEKIFPAEAIEIIETEKPDSDHD